MFKLELAYGGGMALIWMCNIDWHAVGRTKEQWTGTAERVNRIGCYLEAQPRGIDIAADRWREDKGHRYVAASQEDHAIINN